MTEFGPNGTVLKTETNDAGASYSPQKPRIKRVALACFLCGVAACLAVALVAVCFLAIGRFILMIDDAEATAFSADSFLAGAAFSTFLSALNWFVFYITIPAAWLTIGLSLGTFPHKQITAPAPYYRWSAILGAILVGGTCSVFAGLISSGSLGSNPLAYWIGATLTGAVIGTLAGLICGALFRAIVRPTAQVTRLQVEVF